MPRFRRTPRRPPAPARQRPPTRSPVAAVVAVACVSRGLTFAKELQSCGRDNPGTRATFAKMGHAKRRARVVGPEVMSNLRVSSASISASDAVNPLLPDEKQSSAGGGGGRVIGVVEVVDGQHAELRPALDHVASAGAGEKESAVGVGDRACPGGGDSIEALGVDLFARRHFYAP